MQFLSRLVASSVLSLTLAVPLIQAQAPPLEPGVSVGPRVWTLDLPFLDHPDFPSTLGTASLSDMNSNGDMVGNLDHGNSAGFVYQHPGIITPLACPGSLHLRTVTSSINRHGEVVGSCFTTPDNQTRAYLYRPGRHQPYTFIEVPNTTLALGFGLNDHGDAVGYFVEATSGKGRGFVATRARVRAVDAPFPDVQATILTAITNRGAKLGYYVDSAGDAHGFILAGGEGLPLDVPGAVVTMPLDINETWQVVGAYVTQDGLLGAFVWENGVFTTRQLPGLDVRFTHIQGNTNKGDLIGRVSLTAPVGSTEEVLSRGFFVTGLDAQPLPQAVAGMASRSQMGEGAGRVMAHERLWSGEGLPQKGQVGLRR